MNPTPGDTLDIKPLRPTGQPATSADEAKAARARIASLSDPHSGYLQPDQAVSLRQPKPISVGNGLPPIAAPVSPAAEAARPVLKTPSLPSLPTKAKAAKGERRKVPSPVKPIISAVAAFALLLVIFKSQIIFSQLKYLTNKPTPTVQSTPAVAAVSPDPTITIPKINVSAPVVYEPSIAEAAIQKALQGGVVHYGTTVKPGQAGNMVIVGHSSNDWWEPGGYKFVFVLLDKLVAGDQFSINYQSRRYVYEVSNVKVVEPTDLSVLAPTTGPTATLITCTPPGTSWKRLVVQAKQISPEPNAQTNSVADASGAGDQPVQLPGNAPGLGSQFSKAWHNITETVGGWFGHKSADSTPTESTQSLPAGL